MHVRKFEGETLEETLRQIKLELGPDAIILKTVTNKGLKSALKRKKIEITAAISEKDYLKKAQVDKVLPNDMKGRFYENKSSVISNMIDHYAETNVPGKSATTSNYGNLGLNKAVKRVTKEEESSMDLDQFLNEPKEITASPAARYPRYADEAPVERRIKNVESSFHREEVENVSFEEYSILKNKFEDMEQRLYDLNRIVERYDERLPQGLFQLKSTLRSLEIHESFIQRVVKKATFELERNQLEEEEAVFEFALKEMMGAIKTSQTNSFKHQKKNTITILVSEYSSGKSALARKLVAKRKNTLLVQYGTVTGQTKISEFAKNNSGEFHFTDKMLGIEANNCDSVAHVISECRKSNEEQYSIVVDYRVTENNQSDFKKFAELMKRTYENVEIILSLSGIHSEIYNRKMLSSYQQLVDGISISHLDQCLCFGHLFNLADAYPELPLMLFGTGEIIPDDIEDATAERILSGIFKLN